MPIRLKSADAIAKKFGARASAAAGDYKDGVTNPRRDQAEAAIAAKDSYAAGVTAAIGDDRFAKGVQAAGTAKWKRKAETVGASRYPAGVQAAIPDYQSGFAPFLSTLGSIELPPRMPRGDPGNLRRVQVVVEAMRKQKLGG